MASQSQTPPVGGLRPGQARELRVSELANRQRGVVTWEQLLAIGFEPAGIKRRLADGRLRGLHRGVYVVGQQPLSTHSRWLAAILAYGEGALLSHRSAAALWGLAKPRSSAVDVTASAGRQGIRRREGIWIHRGRLHPEDRAARGEIPVTTVARTLFDLAEFASLEQLESAWEEADRLNLLQLRSVERVCERGYGRRALKPIRRLLTEARTPEITRSPLEDRFAAFCRAHRLPTPSFNTTLLGYEIDALWPAQRLAAELDSWEFHRHRAAFEKDRARDAVLQVAGYRTIRITDRRLTNDPTTLLKQLQALLRPNASRSPTEPRSGSGQG
jgi:very-short-patch-repair endonuclease